MEANPSNRREKGTCPVCDCDAEDVTHLREASRDGQNIPARVFDHGIRACYEWADGEMTQNHA
jgi:hypothetical protein